MISTGARALIDVLIDTTINFRVKTAIACYHERILYREVKSQIIEENFITCFFR